MGAPADIRKHLLSVDDFCRMHEVGIIRDDERIELVEGELIEMAPVGSRHFQVVVLLDRAFQRQLGDDALVSVQGPLSLPPRNFFLPDLVIVRSTVLDRDTVPFTEHTLLAVEVSHSTLRFDREAKLPVYARMGVPEVWIFDAEGERVLGYRDPGEAGYRSAFIAAKTETIVPVLLPDVRIDLSKIFREVADQ